MILLVLILLMSFLLLIYYFFHKNTKNTTRNNIFMKTNQTLSRSITLPNYVYAIIDVVIQNIDKSSVIPYGYTGIGFMGRGYNNYIKPYIPPGQSGTIGFSQSGNDVQESIGGDTIWLLAKYAYLPIDASVPVLTAIQSVYWGYWVTGWVPDVPRGYVAANNSPNTPSVGSGIPKGGFSGLTDTKFACSQQGLCLEFTPLSIASTFVSTIAIGTSSTPTMTTGSTYINGQLTHIDKAIYPLQDIHQSCGGNYYYIVWGENNKPITLNSGWYNISINDTYYLGVTNQTLAVTNSSYINTNYPFKNLWYYDNLNNSLSSIAYKTSITLSSTECSQGITVTVDTNSYKYGELIWPRTLMYFPGCNLYGKVGTLKSGTLNLLTTSTIPSNWSVSNKIKPSLPYKDIAVSGWYSFITLDGQNVVWIDENMNIKTQNISIDPSLNITRWYYSTDKRISTIIKSQKYYWPILSIPINDGINNDWNNINIKLTSDYSKSGTWNIFTINSNDTAWTYKPNGFGNNTVFLQHIHPSGQSIYIVFYLSMIKTVMYPSPDSILDILSTVNSIYLSAPILTSIHTGNYVFEIPRDNKCLTSTGTWGECNMDNAWKYDATLGIIKSYNDNNICLYSNLDSNCEGNMNLAIGTCNLATKFIVSEDGRLYDTKCQICYSPKL